MKHMKILHGLEGAMEELEKIQFGRRRHADLWPVLRWSLAVMAGLVLACVVVAKLPSHTCERYYIPMWLQVLYWGLMFGMVALTSVLNFRDASRGLCVAWKWRVRK